MSAFRTSGPVRRALGILPRLRRRSRRGVSAVEFALIAPVMLGMLFGATEASLAITMDRKVTIAASTIGDLVAQSEDLTCAELGALFAVTRSVFQPYSGTPASISVASVAMVGGSPKVEWSRTINSSGACIDAPAYPVGQPISIAGNTSAGQSANLVQDLIPANGAVIVGQVNYAYTSVGTSFFRRNIPMSERFFLRPRKSAKVCFDGITTPGC